MEKVLKTGIIGCGPMMYDFLYDSMKKAPINLVTVCDIDEERLELFSKRYRVDRTYKDYREMIRNEKLDLVISFPNSHDQYNIAKDCMQSGIHVFSERPVCYSIEEANELVEIQRRTGRYTMARLNRRFAPAYNMAREIIDRPEFGRVAMYFAKFQAPEYESERYFIHKHIIHHLDIARYFLGELNITHVDAVRLSDRQIGFNISVASIDGAIGVIQSGSLQSYGYPMERIEITGDGRNVIIDNIRYLEYNRPSKRKESFQEIKLEDGSDTLVWNLNHGQLSNYLYYGFEDGFYGFASSILRGKVPDPNIEDTVRTLKLLQDMENMLNKADR